MSMPWTSEEGESRWSLGQIAKLEEFFVGPLGTEKALGAHEHRHDAFEKERLLMCWDAIGRCLVRVSEWSKEEYWGERVLLVQEYAPNGMGLKWDRRQSDLWELGAPWQGSQASLALSGLSDVSKQELCAHLSGWWASSREAKMIGAALEGLAPIQRRGSGL